MKRFLAILLMVCMMAGSCALAEDRKALGNEKAGYLYTDFQFYDFVNIDISREEAQTMQQMAGWCQYQCFDDCPLVGMVVTLQGFPSAAEAGMEAEEYKQGMVNMVANMWGGDYADPVIDFYRLYITENTEVLLLFFMDQDTTSGEEPMTAAVLCQEEGNYCICLFEYMAETEEALDALLKLLTTFEAGTEGIG